MTYIGYTKNGRDFLAYYTYKTLEEAQAEAAAINETRPETLRTGDPAECEEKTYWASEQSTMETC